MAYLCYQMLGLRVYVRRCILVITISLISQTLLAQTSIDVLRYDQDGSILHAEVNEQVGIISAPDFLHQVYKLSREESLEERTRLKWGNELHIRYRHMVNGVPVLGSELIAHFRNGVLESFNGRLFKPAISSPGIGPEQAIQNAIREVSAEVYMWQIPSEESMLQWITGDSNATYYPKAELYYAPRDLRFNQDFALCYRVEVYSAEPLAKKAVYILAGTGALWAIEDLIHVTDVNGSANTKYRGVKPIVTDSVSPGVYRLRETGRGNGIETYDMNQGTSYSGSVDFTDSDNYWNNYNANYDEVAGDAHYGAEATYDYYLEKFNRNSFDDNGAKIRSFVHYRSNYSNAFWNGLVMTYGDGNGTSYTPLTSVDVCGHEVSHAVTTYTANLIYSYESGALNESFSDIFGNAIEYYADSTQFSWRIGEDITVSGNGIRNMANPKTHGDPRTYLGQYWYGGTGDNGGVHTNSGVQNFWFYLLCEGGSGTNDNGDNYAIDSLGIHKAQQVAYRNLAVYLTPSSQYEDARYYAIRSTRDIFGQCADEVEIVTNAGTL